MNMLAAVAIAWCSPVADDLAGLDELAGRWVLVSMVVDGEKVEEGSYGKMTLEVSKDSEHVMAEGDRAIVRGRIQRLDTTAEPRRIDWTVATRSEFDGSFRPVREQKGIWKLERKTLRLCMAIEPDGERPGKFEAGKGERRALYEWKRVGGSGE